MKMVNAYFVCAEFNGNTHKFGPCETREKAETVAKPFDSRPGWTVSIEEKEVLASDLSDMGF